MAKIGGKLADVSLSLNTCKSPKSTISIRERAQADLEFAKSCIRDIAQTVYHDTALFSNGPTKPVTIAIPNMGEWEGIDITRPDLSLPGMQTVLNGKVHGDSKDYFLDSESIRRAFDEWRNHCIQNRLLWGNLRDRLKGVFRKLSDLENGGHWALPLSNRSKAWITQKVQPQQLGDQTNEIFKNHLCENKNRKSRNPKP